MYRKAVTCRRAPAFFSHHSPVVKNSVCLVCLHVLCLPGSNKGGAAAGEMALRTPFRWSSFSSAVFTGEDKGQESTDNGEPAAAQERRKAQEEILRAARSGYERRTSGDQYTSSFSSFCRSSGSSTGMNGCSSGTFTYTPGEEQHYAHLHHPTRETYEAMSIEELATLLATRKEQVRRLRQIYERFHYEVDKHFRRTVLDYHDKAMHLSQVHGQIQHSSLRINREALAKLREEQEMLTRDKRLVLFLCVIVVAAFWIWTRRHYIHKEELALSVGNRGKAMNGKKTSTDSWNRQDRKEAVTEKEKTCPASSAVKEEEAVKKGLLSRTSASGSEKADETLALHRVSPSVTGAGAYGGGNWFGNPKRSARYRETAWEREQREKASLAARMEDE